MRNLVVLASLLVATGIPACNNSDQPQDTNSAQPGQSYPAEVLRYSDDCVGTPSDCDRFNYTFDSAGRLLTTSHDNCTGTYVNCTTNEYDGAGRLVHKTEKCDSLAGGCYSWEYDSSGRMTAEMHDPGCDGPATTPGMSSFDVCKSYEYTSSTSRRVKQTDCVANSTNVGCYVQLLDSAGRLLSESHDYNCDGTGECEIRVYEHDSAGRQTKQIQRSCVDGHYSTCATNEYDAAGRLIQYTYYDDSECDPAKGPSTCERYSYDGHGRLIKEVRYSDCTGVPESIISCKSYAYEKTSDSPICSWEDCPCEGPNCDVCRAACAEGVAGPCPEIASDCMKYCSQSFYCIDGKFTLIRASDNAVCLEYACN